MRAGKTHKARINIRKATIALLLLSSLALSIVPYSLFHDHEALSGFHCNDSEPEFIVILQERFANEDNSQSENDCDDHEAHFVNEGIECDICDFIFTTSYLVQPVFENNDIHVVDTDAKPLRENLLSDTHLLGIHNKGSPNC